MTVTFKAMGDRTWTRPLGSRRASQFSSAWSDTLRLLRAEVAYLGGSDITIELAVTADQIRMDGTSLKANQYAGDPVIVSFETKKHGAMSYPADGLTKRSYGGSDGWRENVRAVAKSLEALRAIDRYGATTGQQYTGFKALSAGIALPASHMTSEQARAVLNEQAYRRIETAGMSIEDMYRHARRAAHPDHNDGDHTDWNQVEEAAKVLRISA